jgi:hypothetical protein
MTIFLRRASLCLVNQSSIPSLLRHLQRGDPTGDGYGTSQAQLVANNAQIILTSISKHCPILYKAHVGALTKAIADEKNVRLIRVCLQALAALALCDGELLPGDKYTHIIFFHRATSDGLCPDVRLSESCDLLSTQIIDIPSMLPGSSLCRRIKRIFV